MGEPCFAETELPPPNNVTYAEVRAVPLPPGAVEYGLRDDRQRHHTLIERNILDNLLRAIRLRFHLGKEQALALVQSLSSGVYWVAPKLFVLNAKRDMVTNLERALRFYFAQRVPMFPS